MPKAEPMQMLKMLFLCTGNSCRSQMAEGWAHHLKADTIQACSAGIDPHGLNPMAVKVMAEAGVDISTQKSQHVDEFNHNDFDYVMTVCDDAAESCPVFSGNAKVIHQLFDDPPRLAREASNEKEGLAHFRRVRDELRDYVASLPKRLEATSHEG
jgi:arsenate reductase